MFAVFYLQIANCVCKEVAVVFAVLLDQKLRQNDLFQVVQTDSNRECTKIWIRRVLVQKAQNSSSETSLHAGIKSGSKRVIK